MQRVLLLFLLLVNILFLIKILSVTSFFSPSRCQPDFDAYYRTVIDISRGTNPYTVPYMQTLGPPLVFLYFYPFTLFSLPTAQSLNLVINIVSGYLACLVLALYLRRHFMKISVPLLLLLLLLPFWGSFLSRYSLQIGQPHLLITLLIALAITTPRFRLIFLSALFSLKTFFLLPLTSYFISHKSYISIIAVPLLVVLVSLVIIRPSWYLSYINRVPDLKFSRITEPLTDNEYYNQSFRSTAKRLNLSPVFPYIYLALILFAVCAILTTHNTELAILLSFAISPILWQHYFIALFPIFVKSFRLLFSYHKLLPKLLLVTAFILWFPDLRLHEAPVSITNRILASHFFFSLVLLTLAQTSRLRYNSPTNRGCVVQW